MSHQSLSILITATAMTMVWVGCGPGAPTTSPSTSRTEVADSENNDPVVRSDSTASAPFKAIQAANEAASNAPPESLSRPPSPEPRRSFAGEVVETMNASSYTYVHVSNGENSLWAAAPTFAVEAGDRVLVPESMAMTGFHSKTLSRTFDVIYFCSHIEVQERGAAARAPEAGTPDSASPPTAVIDKVAGGLTIEEVFAQKAAHTGKEIAVRGRVVKFNEEILGRNWIHLRDGTGGEGTNDLTVTTTDRVSMGDVVVVRGVLVTDKDFGSGYRYSLIVEDAKVTTDE